MKKIITTIGLAVYGTIAYAQYAPQVGSAGTTAISKDSNVFVNWATGCTLNRGWQNIADTSLGKAMVGDETYVPGEAGNGIVSLGDGGSAIVTFAKPIRNGIGADFAVFENGFIDQTLKPGTAFLELAFVEVSSDGVNYVRFPAFSNNDTVMQLASFDGIDASKIHNLAGKYLANYGTPFDLEELKGTSGLDLEKITHVRIIDVIGALNPSYASRDSRGFRINDPWPTPFSQGGFDLDGIGVIHQNNASGVLEQQLQDALILAPNPSSVNEAIQVFSSMDKINRILVYNALGQLVLSSEGSTTIQLSQPGVYQVHCTGNRGIVIKKLLVR